MLLCLRERNRNGDGAGGGEEGSGWRGIRWMEGGREDLMRGL